MEPVPPQNHKANFACPESWRRSRARTPFFATLLLPRILLTKCCPHRAKLPFLREVTSGTATFPIWARPIPWPLLAPQRLAGKGNGSNTCSHCTQSRRFRNAPRGDQAQRAQKLIATPGQHPLQREQGKLPCSFKNFHYLDPLGSSFQDLPWQQQSLFTLSTSRTSRPR